MTNAILRGKPDAGNPHVRFDEGEVASAKPRRGSLLYKKTFVSLVFCGWLAMPFAAMAGDVAVTSMTAKRQDVYNWLVDITVTFQCAASDVSMVECFFVATNSETKATLPVVHVTQNGADTGSGSTWIRKYIWNTEADVGKMKIGNLVLAVDATIGVQLWENGLYWARCNVGATKPEECGCKGQAVLQRVFGESGQFLLVSSQCL